MAKTAVTIRLDAALLAAVRQRAADDNRTLTNYIETVLKHALVPTPLMVAPSEPVSALPAPPVPQPILIPPQDDPAREAPKGAGNA